MIRVYIPATQEVIDYHSKLRDNFIGFRSGYRSDITIFPNKEGNAKFYRRGVKVGEASKKGLFNYNLDTFSLKESRVVDTYEAKQKAAEALTFASKDRIVTYLRSFDEVNTDAYWEHGFDHYDLSASYHSYGEKVEIAEKVWEEAYSEVYGEGVLVDNAIMAKIVTDKGHCPIQLSDNLTVLFKKLGVKQAKDVLDQNEIAGKKILPPSQAMVKCLDQVWSTLDRLNMTEGKARPELKSYDQIEKAEGNSLGYYRQGGDTVYIRADVGGAMLTEVMIEEVAHYITRASDLTREFQSFAFKLAANLMTVEPIAEPEYTDLQLSEFDWV
jgi:hypothetical protein